MRDYKLLLIDLDGTMYRGTERIEAAPFFIQQLEQQKQPYLFLTNNSTKTPQQVVEHLAHFDIYTDESKVYTSSQGMAQYISNQKDQASVYMIGEEGLRIALEEKGCQLVTQEELLSTCDYVVCGLDRNITYEKLSFACMAVRAGARFLSTNADKALPTEKGLLPGNGSLTGVVAGATGVQPTYIGKPESIMIDLIIEKTGVAKEDILLIGDNYETDILAGIRTGIDTALVYTGYSQKKDIEFMEIKPTFQWDSLLDCWLTQREQSNGLSD